MLDDIVLRVAERARQKPFDTLKPGKALTFIAYHWCLTRDDAEELVALWESGNLAERAQGKVLTPGFFVTDDPNTWKQGNKALLKMSVHVANPFFIGKDKLSLEQRIGPTNKWINLLKRNQYDAVGNTTENNVVGTRQMLLFKPNQQIRSMVIVKVLP